MKYENDQTPSYSLSVVVSKAGEDDLEKESGVLEDASVTDTLLESPAESHSDGSEGDRPENASSTKSKKVPRTPFIIKQ